MTWQALKWTRHSRTTVVADDPRIVTGKRVIAECESEDVARLVAVAPRLLAALRKLQANPNDPRSHRVALDAIAEAAGNADPLDDAIYAVGGRFTL